ncbi:MAG: chemotaxis protein CheX [bacterium]|nr:chemotaxis protein CheX [bacterium]
MHIEATVEFSGDCKGAVVLRCTADGAVDIARGLLMLADREPVELADIEDALGECANLMGGSLKTKVLDPVGEFSLGIPNTETQVSRDGQQYHGSLVYQLSEGHAVVEVWL